MRFGDAIVTVGGSKQLTIDCMDMDYVPPAAVITLKQDNSSLTDSTLDL